MLETQAAPPAKRCGGSGRGRYLPVALLVLVWLGCGHREVSTRKIDALTARGRTTQALQLVENGLLRETGDPSLHWQLVLRKAQLLASLNRREAALAWIRTALLKDPPAEFASLLLREQAMMERDQGLLRDSDGHFLTAIEHARRSRQPQLVARLEVQRSYVLIQLGQLEEADKSLSAAEEYGLKSGDHSPVWNRVAWILLYYRGLLQLGANQFEDALVPLAASRQGFRKANQAGPAGMATISLAWCYFHLGQLETAIALGREAVGMADPEDLHLIWGNLGSMLLDARDFRQAAAYSDKAIALAERKGQAFGVKWRNNLTLALIEQGNWKQAEAVNQGTLERLKQIEDSQARSRALINQGRIETAGGAYPSAERILKSVAESGDGLNPHVLDAYSALATLYQRMNRPEDARRQLDLALNKVDRDRARLHEDENKLSYISKLTDVHRQYVDFLMDRGDKAGAFALAESSRARLLRERLDLARANIHHYGIARYQAAARASGATFLSYWIGPERSYLWTISPNHFASYSLPPEPEIRGLVERYQRAIERDASAKADDASAGAKLFQTLLPSGILQEGGRYLIVPDGPLYALNFETLPVPGNRRHYWIEDATIAVAPSLDLLLANQLQPPPGRSLLLVGDAIEWNPQYPKLLHAKKEMADIEQVFPASGRKVLAEAAATPAAYQRSNPAQFAYIHFTAHATANKNSPFDSAIILSRENGSPSPGKLSAKEVLNTRVRAELVTISACHSAGARTYWGEGLVGFAWAFLQSGAHGVIAGLWDVSDYSSPRLMHDLYAGLAASETPADALRAAKLNLIRAGKYADPYYWGAFQVYQGALYSGKKAQPAGEDGIQNAELRR
jgi:CHAT domain-containing protein/Tfp pilus assembly protein PilF